jgi:hypothetical protein
MLKYLRVAFDFFWDRVILMCFILAVSLLGANMQRTEESDLIQEGAVIDFVYEGVTAWLTK